MQLTDIRKIITEQKNRLLRKNNLLLSQHFLIDDNVGKNFSYKGHPLNEGISVLIIDMVGVLQVPSPVLGSS